MKISRILQKDPQEIVEYLLHNDLSTEKLLVIIDHLLRTVDNCREDFLKNPSSCLYRDLISISRKSSEAVLHILREDHNNDYRMNLWNNRFNATTDDPVGHLEKIKEILPGIDLKITINAMKSCICTDLGITIYRDHLNYYDPDTFRAALRNEQQEIIRDQLGHFISDPEWDHKNTFFETAKEFREVLLGHLDILFSNRHLIVTPELEEGPLFGTFQMFRGPLNDPSSKTINKTIQDIRNDHFGRITEIENMLNL